MPTLQTFFAEMVPYVMGHATTETVVSRLGRSPSGDKHLSVYAGVVPTNLRRVMEALFPSARRAADAVAPGLWRSLVQDLFAAHPPRHPDPNWFGEPFPRFLADRRAAKADIPAFLEELADYHWIRFLAMTAPEPGFEHSTFVRYYTHAIPKYARAVESDSDAAPVDVPAAAPTVVVVYRSLETQRPAVLFPSAEELLAIARAQGESIPREQAAHIAANEIDAAERKLLGLGVITTLENTP